MTVRRCTLSLLAALTWKVSVAGLIIQPPTVYYIGPEASCDYATIQEALDDIFSCPIPGTCTPLGGPPQLRLSATYVHAGNFEINNSLSIIGGFSACGAASDGTRKTLTSPSAGPLIVLDGPDSNPIQVTLGTLTLNGDGTVSDRGGVLELKGGVDLMLENTRVTGGVAVQGGGVAMHGVNNTLSFAFGSLVSGNSASEEGGGIWCEGIGTVDLASGIIRRNAADRRGGGIFLDGCDLVGDTPFENRFIDLNTVRNSDPGKGGGVYVTGGGRVRLGALLSRTLIDRNQILQEPVVEEFGDAIGGGIHAEDGEVLLRNVHVTGNIAPAGAAISAGAGSVIDIDRLSGPCTNGDSASGQNECSLIARNITSGRLNVDSESEAWRSGLGVVFYGFARRWVLRRTTVRDNQALCEGGCGDAGGSLFEVNGDPSGGGLFQLDYTLVVDNFLDATCGFFCDLQVNSGRVRYGLFSVRGYSANRLIRNTIVRNEYKDATDNDVNVFFMRTDGNWLAVGNIIWDNDVGDFQDQNDLFRLGRGVLTNATCNISDYTLLDSIAESSAANSQEDPLLIDPGLDDYRIASNSPALNRCDEVGAFLRPTYDVAGRAVPRDHGEINSGLNGFYDTGALEHQLFSPDEVDLVASMRVDVSAGPPGAVFEVILSNIGLTSALAGNYSLSFSRPSGGYQQLDTAWTCVEQSGIVECAPVTSFDLDSTLSTPPLVVEVMPDVQGRCALDVTAEAGEQPDVRHLNNRALAQVFDCDGDSVLPDSIFADSFEPMLP